MKDCLLFSGGLDSFIAYHYLGKPDLLYVKLYGRYMEKELAAIRDLDLSVTTMTCYYGNYAEQRNAHMPGRNLLLGLMAAGFGYDKIWLVAQKEEQDIPDRTPEFFESTSRILSFHFEKQVIFANPFSHMDKIEMVEWYLKQGLPVEDLRKSVSCYSATGMQCGACSSCFRKFVALKVNGIECESWFQGDIREWGITNYIPNLSDYSEKRKTDILKALSTLV